MSQGLVSPQFPPRRLRILGQAALGAGDTTIYTVPAGVHTLVPEGGLILCNTAGGNRTATIYVRITGAAASNANKIVADITIAYSLIEILESVITLGPGDVISGSASLAGSITATLSGFEFNE